MKIIFLVLLVFVLVECGGRRRKRGERRRKRGERKYRNRRNYRNYGKRVDDEAPEGEAPEGEAPEGEAPEGEAPTEDGEGIHTLAGCAYAVNGKVYQTTECMSETENVVYGEIVGFFFDDEVHCCNFICKDGQDLYDVAVGESANDECPSSILHEELEQTICDQIGDSGGGGISDDDYYYY